MTVTERITMVIFTIDKMARSKNLNKIKVLLKDTKNKPKQVKKKKK